MTQLPKIVTSRLLGGRSSEHPDADLLTAFAECALAGQERDRVLNHLSGCSECRQVVALALPDFTTGAVSVPTQVGRSWLRAPVLRWGALAACIVVIATAVLIRKGEWSPHHGEVQVAMQQPAAPSPAIQTQREASGGPKSAPSKPEAKAKAAKSPVANVQRTPPDMAFAKVPATSPNPPVSANAPYSDLMKRSENLEMQADATSPAAPLAEVDQQSRARRAAAPATATPLFTPRPSTETAASTMGGAARLTDLRPPSWRLSNDGLPERSFSSDHWEKVQVDHKTGFRAIAALGMEVWIGGAGGLLYHSEDMGLNWTRMIPVASSATLTDDITGIAFADHLHGKVETNDGRSWVTSDAGKTWELH